MDKDINYKPNVHEGRNMRRLREILGVTQETLAMELGVSQPAVWKLEQKEKIDEDMLRKVAQILRIPVEAIKNYDEDATITLISNTFTNKDSHPHGFYNKDSGITTHYYNCVINPLDKVTELYERIIELEKEKNQGFKS